MEYTIAKGVFDIVPFESKEEDKWRESSRWQYVEKIFRETAHDFGYRELRTPIFERTELFVRSVGEGTDIVSKEMYTFNDKAGRSLTLRPEGTAPSMRAFIEKKLYAQSGLHKYYYLGPMFRYERPQAGRYRQHHQFGAEALGNATAEQDVEIIELLCQIYRRLDLKNLTVCINSVGNAHSRAAYKKALVDYLTPLFPELSKESQERFDKNILRILDSKDLHDQKILTQAPQLLNYLDPDCKSHFEKVLRLLDQLHIHYKIQPFLVRGLDYYNKTVFEITSEHLGAQNSVGGGGRYDGLTELLGGPHLPAVGFALGIERLLQTMLKQNAPFSPAPHPFVFLIPLGEEASSLCFSLTCQLRREQISTEIDLSSKKVQHGLSLANSLGAQCAIVIGAEELASRRVVLKWMATRQTEECVLDDLIAHLLLVYKKSLS